MRERNTRSKAQAEGCKEYQANSVQTYRRSPRKEARSGEPSEGRRRGKRGTLEERKRTKISIVSCFKRRSKSNLVSLSSTASHLVSCLPSLLIPSPLLCPPCLQPKGGGVRAAGCGAGEGTQREGAAVPGHPRRDTHPSPTPSLLANK